MALTPQDNPNDNNDVSNTLNQAQINELGDLRERFNSLLVQLMQDNPNNTSLDLAKVWRETTDLTTLYDQLSDLKKCLDSLRPLSIAQVNKLNESFDVEYTYESNRIEGNTLSKKETHLVINKGITVKGKSLTEHLEAINHQEAIDYIRDIANKQVDFNQRTLLDIHSLVLHGIDREDAGKYRQENVTISGSEFEPPMFLQVPQLMDDYFAFYDSNKCSMHPVELASEMHERLVTIHPFIDGNGRTARLVMNLMLLQHGYPVTILKSDNDKRHDYYDSLEVTQIGNDPEKKQFKTFIAKNVKQWLFNYLNLLAPNGTAENQNKGYYFFKRVESLINQ